MKPRRLRNRAPIHRLWQLAYDKGWIDGWKHDRDRPDLLMKGRGRIFADSVAIALLIA